jgi:hypothetical protein
MMTISSMILATEVAFHYAREAHVSDYVNDGEASENQVCR